MTANLIRKSWRDAATLMIVARCGATNNLQNKFKLLMLKRSNESKFMPNLFVFPGGVICENDFLEEWHKIIPAKFRSLQKTKSRPYLYTNNDTNMLSPELAFRICSLRETFEESGILLVRDERGKHHTLAGNDKIIGGEFNRLGHWRDKVNTDAKFFLQLFHDVKIFPDVKSLQEWSTWLTPTFMKMRFDTIFYIVFVDHVTEGSSADETEVSEMKWFTPTQIFSDQSFKVPPPQFYEYCRMKRFNSYDDLEKFTVQREIEGLQTFCPEKYKTEDGHIIVYPGDDHHTNDWNKTTEHLQMNISDLSQENINRIEFNKNIKNKMFIKNNVSFCGHQPIGGIVHNSS